jgi:hypothetical protein
VPDREARDTRVPGDARDAPRPRAAARPRRPVRRLGRPRRTRHRHDVDGGRGRDGGGVPRRGHGRPRPSRGRARLVGEARARDARALRERLPGERRHAPRARCLGDRDGAGRRLAHGDRRGPSPPADARGRLDGTGPWRSGPGRWARPGRATGSRLAPHTPRPRGRAAGAVPGERAASRGRPPRPARDRDRPRTGASRARSSSRTPSKR